MGSFNNVRHLSREFAEIFSREQCFQKKKLKACKHVVFSECFMAFLALFDIRSENRIFEPRTVFLQISLNDSKHV